MGPSPPTAVYDGCSSSSIGIESGSPAADRAMPAWTCNKCGRVVSSTYDRNLVLLVHDHKTAECPHKDAPREQLRLTPDDEKMLEEMGVAW